jgi:hypothetical protein
MSPIDISARSLSGGYKLPIQCCFGINAMADKLANPAVEFAGFIIPTNTGAGGLGSESNIAARFPTALLRRYLKAELGLGFSRAFTAE